MRVSLNGFGVEFMNWNGILNLGKPPQEPTSVGHRHYKKWS